MGRKPLPQEELNLRGTARNDRLRPTVSGEKELAEIQMWNVQGYAELTPRAKEIYRKVARRCNRMKILQETDLLQMVLYAREYDWALTAMAEEDRVGVMYSTQDKEGNTIWHSNPARMVVNSCISNINKIGSNFGLSPVDRQRLKVQAEDPKAKGLKAMLAMVFEEPETPDEQ